VGACSGGPVQDVEARTVTGIAKELLTMGTRFSRLALSAVVTALLLTGCASVHVRKLDANGQVIETSADGLRFYLPRPYVSVFEPFIVASEAFLASGEVSPDGQYVLITGVPDGLSDLLPATGGSQSMGPMRIRATAVRWAEAAGPQATAPVADKHASGDNPGNAKAPDGTASSAAPARPLGGLLNLKATNDNAAFAITPQPRYFNVLWLPDFDEQYVVQTKGRLGNTSVVIGLGQGWSLQGLDATVDNSAWAKPMIEAYAKTIETLQKAATATASKGLPAVALAPVAAGAGGPNLAGGPEKLTPPAAETVVLAAGLRVTVKVTKLRVAAPGLYPILKPKEMSQVVAHPASDGRVLKPVAPFTNIAFNTYDVIVVEAARATGDSALRVHQYGDSNAPAAAAGSAASADAGEGKARAGHEAAINAALATPANKTKDGKAYQAKVTYGDAGLPMVEVSVTDGLEAGEASKLPTQADAAKIILKALKDRGIEIKPSAIKFVP
jgi:hypothetical protein